jgi:hypothetical protein
MLSPCNAMNEIALKYLMVSIGFRGIIFDAWVSFQQSRVCGSGRCPFRAILGASVASPDNQVL